MRGDSSPAASSRGWLSLNCPSSTGVGGDLRRAGLAAFCIWPTLSSAAAETAGARLGGLDSGPLRTEGIMETAAGLLLVLAVIIALAWAVRRFGRLPMAGKGLVNVVGGISLGSRERIVVVQVEDTRLVLGVAPGRIETLHVLDPTEASGPVFAETLKTEIPESAA